MPSVNEEIRDLSIRHQVGVLRLSSGVLRKLIPILNRSDEDVVGRLAARSATLEGSFTSKRLAALLESLRVINRDAHVELGRELRSELRGLATYEAAFQQRLLTNAIPVAWDIVTPSVQTLNAVVTARPFQGKLLKDWLSELEAGRARRVRDAVRLGMVQGETVDQIVRRVRGTRALQYRDGVMEISRRGAESMVRTAVAHTASAARTELYRENADLIKSEVWVTALDSRVCLQCMNLSGREFENGKGPQEPLHINCRCIRVIRTKSWRELGFDIDELEPSTRASMNGQVPADISYNDWLKSQPASVQDDALGRTRGRLFRTGDITVDGFTSRHGDDWTLDVLRGRDSSIFEKAGV